MALGRPSITTPAAMQLQAVQQTIANIRERFAGLEAFVLQLQSGAGTALNLQSASIRSLQFQIDQLRARIDAIESADDGDQLTVTFLSGEAIDVGAPVWVSNDGVVSNIDPDAVLASSGFFGIAAQTVVAGVAIPVRLPGGVVTIPGSTFTTGRPLYAQLGGVTHFPAGNSLPVGVAIGADQMSVGYGFNVLGDETFDPTGQDDMAMAYGLRGAGGGILPVVTGEVPPVLVYLPDGNLVYVEVP